jgi:hypothetical protein
LSKSRDSWRFFLFKRASGEGLDGVIGDGWVEVGDGCTDELGDGVGCSVVVDWDACMLVVACVVTIVWGVPVPVPVVVTGC